MLGTLSCGKSFCGSFKYYLLYKYLFYNFLLNCGHIFFIQCLLEIMMGCRVVISGDDINPDDGAILIMNHRNRLDWFFLWSALLHATKPPAHRCKFVLKSDVRIIPGIGWGLQMAGYLFIHRNWEKDKALLKRSLDYFKALKNKYQVNPYAYKYLYKFVLHKIKRALQIYLDNLYIYAHIYHRYLSSLKARIFRRTPKQR